MRSSKSADHVLIDLDEVSATDPHLAGAKASALARARRAGLPVLPGCVVPVPAARATAFAGSTALAERGRGAARPAALGVAVPEPLQTLLAAAVHRLGGRAIVRSSSPLEADHRWSGAFSSVNEVGPADIATAVRTCWASAFAPDPIDRAAQCGVAVDQLLLGVLIQPELRPSAGGLARVVGDRVQVTAVAGHPGELLSGWATGETGWVGEAYGPSDGVVLSNGIIDHSVAIEIAMLARQVADLLGHDHIEWAVAAGSVYLLQSSAGSTMAPEVQPSALPSARALRPRSTEHARLAGTVSVAGDAVGQLRHVRPHEVVGTDGPGDGTVSSILVCDLPLPALAPLLFGARGLVTTGGPIDCHLIEVARAIGVPVLARVPLASIGLTRDEINGGAWQAAIDGARAELIVLARVEFPSATGQVADAGEFAQVRS